MGYRSRYIRFIVLTFALGLLWGAAVPAQASAQVALPLGAGNGQELAAAPSTSTNLPRPQPCSSNSAGSTYTGQAPYTMHFFGRISCGYPIISETANASLYFGNGELEATGNTCSRSTGVCSSTGSYSHIYQTMPNMAHDLRWYYKLRLDSGYAWVDAGTGSNCSGYGSRTLTCVWMVFIRTPVPVVDG